MSASEAVQEKTPAQRLAEEHAAHHATVEDTVDQDDIEHPPPPHANTDGAINGTNGVMSAKAAGKQKASEKSAGLNTQDEEAFPTLGGSSKSTAKAPGWGAKGGLKTSGSPSLYTPPGSGAATPSSVPALGAVNLPGKNRDHFDVEISDIDKTKSIEKVLADAKRKYRVNTGIQEINAGKARRFYAEGPQQNQVRQALMDISKAISKEQRLSIPVPATVSANIIGRAGANIRKLEEVHGVKINITRDSRGPSTNPDDPRIDTVEVRGDAAATRVVKQKIEDMVKQLQPKIDMPLRGIPPEFYPFLAGRHAEEISKLENDSDLRVKIPQYHTWQSQPPPRSAPKNARPSFVPHGDSHIVISGDQAAAMQARAAIEALAEQLEQELILEELMCEQVLHPYVVGHRGMNPLEFLEETGCAIILPPGHHETEEIHLIGPKDKLDAGRARAEQLIAQKHHRPYDLRKQFADAPMGPERHSRALAQYLQQKAFEREFRSTHQSDLVFPRQANADPSWGIVSSDGARAVAARSDLTKVLQAFPTARIGLVEVDPFYHEHLGNMHSQRMREDHGVHMIVPEDPEEPVVLVYEGPSQDGPFQIPRERPTSPEVKEFQRALQEAQALLMGSIPQGPISSHDMSVPRKHHDRVRRFVKNQQPQQASQFPVQLDFGNQRASKGAADSIFLRGPNDDDIAALRKAIEQYMIEVEQDEKERGYVTYTDFPEKFVKNLVGKNGANIKALREKHDVEIDAREPGKVKIQGPQKKAEACKAEIIKLGKSYEDEVNYTIKVDPKFHGELIGKSGENLNKLQSKVNNDVRIDFPRANRNADDNASEAGGNQRQAADEIRIRGPKAKADKIRDELLSLTQYLQDNSHTATVSVHKDQIRSLIGRGGAEMDKLRGETGAQIDVPNKPVEGDRVTITVKGPKAAVDKARQELQKRSKAFDAVVTKTITVDRKHHRDIIGSKGSNIQRIVQEAGGPERSAEAVQFPKQGETSNDLTIKGTEDVVDKIVAAIQAYVEDKDNQVTETVDVPVEQHRLLIGTNGNIRKSIEDKFKVSLDIPRRESGKTGVKIAGKPAEVQQAREHIISLTKRPEGTTILVPRALHHAISNEGRIFRDLSRRGIKIDHKGQQPPAKPKANGVGRKSNNAAAPLITDEPSDEAVYNFDIVSMNDQAEGETGEIPWILIGNKDVTEDAISKVRQQIEDAIEKAREPKHIGYLRLADPRLHRHVIGQRGATINEIRKKTGCDIQVPGGQKSQNDSEEITIVGDEEGVMLAKDLILQELEKASN